jgi:DNA-binding LacI/PurR family transcriptional regulator
MSVTIKDVAREAGVSATTVSFALRGKKPGLRPLSVQTVNHVKGIARDLGYRPNHIAASLVGQKTHTIELKKTLANYRG